MDLFQAIHDLYHQYQVPKLLGFVPDRLDITVTRQPNNQFALRYTERFLYLPDYALDAARDNAIQLLQQLRLPIDTIQPVDKGVQLQLTSDARIIWHLIIELMMQLNQPEASTKTQLDAMFLRFQLFRALVDPYWHWDDQVSETFTRVAATLDTVMQDHPAFYEELMQLLKQAATQIPAPER
jgi:hypothetical protein